MIEEQNDVTYIIGLDIGIASVGWACLACDENGNVKHILDLGVRTFDLPENPKNGDSLAAPRRSKRSLRRRIRRKSFRMERARELLGIDKELPNAYVHCQRADVYELRVKALDEKISESDFARVIMLILKRRGYNSGVKSSKDEEEGKLKAAISHNREEMREMHCRTVGELLYRKCAVEVNGRRTYNVRNHNNYDNCVHREMLAEELRLLFAAQRSMGNALASEIIEEKFLEIFSSQRNFDEGPGKGSKYSAMLKVGNCEFENGEKRAPKAAYSFERFRVLQSVNHLVLSEGGKIIKITESERKELANYCFGQEKVTYSQVRKFLKIPTSIVFSGLSYKTSDKSKDSLKETESKARFSTMPAFTKLRKCLTAEHAEDAELLDSLAEVLTYNKSEKKIRDEFEKRGLSNRLGDEEVDRLTEVSFSGFGHMSLKALNKVLPYLEEGLVYSEAMEKAGYNHSDPFGEIKRGKFIDVNSESYRENIKNITSGVVLRAVSQTVKVVNAIIRKYGSPFAVNVELARELGKVKKERDKIKRDNDKRFENNENKMRELRDKFNIVNPSGQQLIKYLLYEEQKGKCIYSGKALDLNRVMKEDKYAEVDHVIPYSRSFCDARYNKVLVLTEENQKKGNSIPFEYLGGGDKWEEYCARVNAIYNGDYKKKENLLREKFTKENGKEWKDRSLNDTKYISKFIYNLLRNFLLFSNENSDKKKRVTAVNGSVTSFARKLWGINKIREDGDLHHCIDAVVIGCIGDGFIQSLTAWAKRRELRYAQVDGKIIDKETGEILEISEIAGLSPDKLPLPHSKFIKELEMRLSKNPCAEEFTQDYLKFGYDGEEVANINRVFVSRAPERKAKSELHLDTMYSQDRAGNTVLKTKLTDLTYENGEIKGYNEFAKRSDPLLYTALIKRLQEFDGDAKKAFVEPFYKPKSDGTDGPIVKKVPINQKEAHVKLNRGNARNGSMVRTDIFKKDGKFYGVPVYSLDIYTGKLPNKAVTAGKSEDEWQEMTEEYEFLFSLYPNDMVEIESDKGINFHPLNKSASDIKLNKTKAYYKGFDRRTGAMDIILHDDSYRTVCGIKGLKSFVKYTVEVLGDVHKVTSEKRPSAKMKNN